MGNSFQETLKKLEMKKIIKLLLIFLILTGVWIYFSKSSLAQVTNPFSFSYCDQPIHYRVDTIDPKFNLTREQFLTDISQANDIWGKAYGKTLFTYDPTGKLSINMIYDERQSLTTQINNLEGSLEKDKQSLDPQMASYQKQSADLKQKISDYNKEVADWNSKGGAPPDVYEKLIQEKESLAQEAQRLNNLAKSLNQSTQDYNSQVADLNKTVQDFNQAIEQRPEEGLFRPDINTIEIYFNISQTELIHTLAHELGHSLGMGHVSSQNAIMFSKTNQQLIPTQEDLVELQEVCKKHNIFEIAINYYSGLIRSYQQSFLH